jgi:Rv0078B-related antitoxin
MDDAARERLAQKLRLTLALHEDGVAMMRLNLRRRHPTESDAEVDARLRAWLHHRPGAEHGDSDGLPPRWFRVRT